MWPFTLGWLHRLGMPLTLPIAHLLNAAVTCAACIALARAMWLRWNLAIAAVAVTPAVIQWSKGFYSQDFYSLSTEVLPFAFLVAACVVSFPRAAITPRRALAGALLFGCAVWSKYSFVFLVAVGLVALIAKMLASGHHPRRTALTCVAAPVAPLAVLVGWALLFGVPWWKITETFHITLSYASGGGLDGNASAGARDRVSEVANAVSMFRGLAPLGLVLAVACVAVCAHHGIGSVRNWRTIKPADLPHHTITATLAVLSVIASFASLAVLVPIYPHYTYLFIAGLFQAGFLLSSTMPVPRETNTNFPGAVLLSAALVAVWALPPVIQRGEITLYRWSNPTEARTTLSKAFTTEGALWERGVTPDGRPLASLCPRGSRVIVWGWAPDLYSQYDWTPATRYVITTVAMIEQASNSQVDTYRPRLLADFRAETPRCVVDGATPALFAGWGPSMGIEAQWPEFAAELATSYTKQVVTLHRYSPLTVWVRNT